MSDEPVIDKMLERWKLANEAENDNRQRFLRCMKFAQGGDNQWDANVLSNYRQQNRPTESYNQIPNFTNQVTNDMRMNMAQTSFIPNDDEDKEKAEVMEDLVRAIQATSEGEVAYDAAAYTQVTGGWGYWRYRTEYEDESDPDNDNQVIKVDWIPNPLMVYDDPNCTQQDRLDREWLIHTYDIPTSEYNSANEDHQYDRLCIQSIGDSAPEWMTNEYIRVAEYWTVETKTEKVKNKKGEDREIKKRKIIWRKVTAKDILEEREFPGDFIPYVFVAGVQVFIDGEQQLSGLVERMIAPQIQYNRWSNAATELVGMAPLAPFILDPDQITGWESIWATANVAKHAFLPAKTVDPQTGKQFNMPQRAQNGADISSTLALVQQAQQNFYNTSGIFPASLGQASNEKSGKAIMARQREGDVSTFHFMDNMARALRAGGRILLPLIKAVYDGSRIVKGIRPDNTTRMVKINQSFKTPKGETKKFDLTSGTYEVMVSTGPSFTTKRQESQEAMLQLASQTNLMEVAPDLFYAAQDWPGADKIAERYKKTPVVAQLADDDENPNQIPPQLASRMQEMEQVMQQMGQELQQAQGQLQSKQLDIAKQEAALQGQLAKNQMDAQSSSLQMEIKLAQAEIQNSKLQLEIQARDIKLDAQRLEDAQAQLADQQRMQDLMGKLVQKDIQIKQIAAKREMDLADQQLQMDYISNMQQYESIQNEIKDLVNAANHQQQVNSIKNTVDKSSDTKLN